MSPNTRPLSDKDRAAIHHLSAVGLRIEGSQHLLERGLGFGFDDDATGSQRNIPISRSSSAYRHWWQASTWIWTHRCRKTMNEGKPAGATERLGQPL
jgi:hypothetical protein